MKGRQPLFVPCSPKGSLELLSRSGISIKGKHAVVVGRSNIVGLPVSLLLLKEDATVTIVHSRTKEPENIVREPDIVIAAARQATMVSRMCRSSCIPGRIPQTKIGSPHVRVQEFEDGVRCDAPGSFVGNAALP